MAFDKTAKELHKAVPTQTTLYSVEQNWTEVDDTGFRVFHSALVDARVIVNSASKSPVRVQRTNNYTYDTLRSRV